MLPFTGEIMRAVQIPDHLKHVIDRQVAEGHATSDADYVVNALHAYAEHLEAENEIAAMAVRADADMASGRFVTVTGAEDSEALHASIMARLRARMPPNDEGR
jgi:Arc/MetJ-type ribon-helix-helix transcriptional regulator